MSTPLLRCRLEQTFGAFTLDAALELPAQGVTALFGPSGAGKSLLLRCLAGLQRAHGEVVFGDEAWQQGRRFVPPPARGIGYVAQEPTLFPHLTVRGNLEYGLRRCRSPRLRFDDVVAALGLAGLLPQRPHTLSGGQRQRVAIGRALLASPRLLLLDEPLAALDLPARRSLLADLRRLQRTLQVPMLFVTHAADEVERVADRVAFIRQGRIIAVQSLVETAARLDSPLFVDDGPVTVFDADCVGWDPAESLLELAAGPLRFHVPAGARPDGPVRIRIAARDVALALSAPADASFQNVFELTVAAMHAGRPGCGLVECIGSGGERLVAELSRRAIGALALQPGVRVHALVKAVALLDPVAGSP